LDQADRGGPAQRLISDMRKAPHRNVSGGALLYRSRDARRCSVQDDRAAERPPARGDSEDMTRGQLALMRSLFVVGVLVLAAGIAVLIGDISTAEPDCHTNLSGYEVCRSTSPSLRGLGIGALGFLT